MSKVRKDDGPTDLVAQLMVHVVAFAALAYDSSDDEDDSDNETDQRRVMVVCSFVGSGLQGPSMAMISLI